MTLFIVPTPIGNLGDLSPRALETLKNSDYILAEDTRVSAKLMRHFQIETPMKSHHKFNEEKALNKVLSDLEEGQTIALISDAGIPTLCDPGERLIFEATKKNLQVIPLPGPCAYLTALSASGLQVLPHHFYGFLEKPETKKLNQIKVIAQIEGTHIFYESCHRIIKTLELIDQNYPDLHLVLAKELTKTHERFMRGTASHLLSLLTAPKLTNGEWVLLLPHIENRCAALSDEMLLREIERLKEEGYSSKEILSILSETFGIKRNRLYALLHNK